MTLAIELRPEIEAGLAVLAAERGLSLTQYVHRLLDEQVPGQEKPALSPAERARIWRESVKGVPHTAPLSDDAVSRESIYAGRG